jgi:Tfp pilus assembly protein PilV
MRSVHRFSGQEGVSMVEVVVALFILAFVGVAAVAGIYGAVKANDVSRNHIQADGLVRSELEYVKSSAFLGAPWTYSLPGTPPSWDLSHTSVPSGYEGYSITLSATALSGVPYSNDGNIQKVRADVSYKGANVLSVETYLTNQ